MSDVWPTMRFADVGHLARLTAVMVGLTCVMLGLMRCHVMTDRYASC